MRNDAEAARREGEVGLEEPLELEERLVVEGDGVERRRRSSPASGRQYATACAREAGVVLLAREALLLRGGDDLAVDDEAGGRVVVEGRDAEDAVRHGGQKSV